jgi:hypothetical protein
MTDRCFGLVDEIRNEDGLLSWLDLVERGVATTSIQGFKLCHLEALLIAIVVRKLSPWQILIPAVLMFHHIGSKHILQNLI